MDRAHVDTALIEPWLEPLADDGVCGPDLEYDPVFLELGQVAAGRPETQFGPAEPPSWPAVRELAQALLERSRDLRVAMLWCRAAVHLEGLEGLPAGLALLHGLLERFWSELHPRPDPDDGDTFARLSILGGLDAVDGLLGDVRKSLLLVDRRLGGLRVRDVEVALEKLAPRADESPSTPAQIEGLLSGLPDLTARLRSAVAGALQGLGLLQGLMNERFGVEHAVDVKALRVMLADVCSLLPDPDEDADAAQGPSAAGFDEEAAAVVPARRFAGGGDVASRDDAVRAIHRICAYLEQHEPTNPAQLLLRRAERLIDKNFIQLMRDLAPDAVNEVARILGVAPDAPDAPDAVEDPQSSY